jgi:hypothetical protein
MDGLVRGRRRSPGNVELGSELGEVGLRHRRELVAVGALRSRGITSPAVWRGVLIRSTTLVLGAASSAMTISSPLRTAYISWRTRSR